MCIIIISIGQSSSDWNVDDQHQRVCETLGEYETAGLQFPSPSAPQTTDVDNGRLVGWKRHGTKTKFAPVCGFHVQFFLRWFLTDHGWCVCVYWVQWVQQQCSRRRRRTVLLDALIRGGRPEGGQRLRRRVGGGGIGDVHALLRLIVYCWCFVGGQQLADWTRWVKDADQKSMLLTMTEGQWQLSSSRQRE